MVITYSCCDSQIQCCNRNCDVYYHYQNFNFELIDTTFINAKKDLFGQNCGLVLLTLLNAHCNSKK